MSTINVSIIFKLFIFDYVMLIYYGIVEDKIDVTRICMDELLYNNTIIIHYGERFRNEYFTDNVPDINKYIIIEHNDIITTYDEYNTIEIDIRTNEINVITDLNILDKLQTIHSKLTIQYGNMTDEFPEQMMAARYLTGSEKVLEIGGNIGRNSLVIASIVPNDQFVCLESDDDIAKQLIENRDNNGFQFHVEASALSKKKLIQSGWNTIQSDTLLDGYKWVNIISLDKLKTKYNIEFDTLILDCEGAFYYILQDFPEILTHINTIIMENDYNNIDHKLYVDQVLKNNNFQRIYVNSGGWGPCEYNFFEVWRKKI